jgi:tetratricopeptide (TPR) repeat protein
MALLALLALMALPAGTALPQDRASAPQAAEIRALLDAGKADEARDKAVLALEFAPDDAELLELCSTASEKADDADAALWYARLQRQTAIASGTPAGRLKPLDQRIASLDPLPPEDREAFDAALKRVFELGQTCAKRKLYGNAVELLSRCEGTPYAEKAGQQLDKIYKNKKAVQALLESGLDVPVTRKQKRSAKWIARNDEKHAAWDDAYRIKTDNYTVVTNVGWELGEAISQAMEQMNRFYRKVFHHKERGGGTARCAIHVYRDREEFLGNVDEDMHDTAGFFVPGENRVSTYDPRPSGETIAELWGTLFHECSHQFTEMIFASAAPSWLDEGTASYFEGARLQPNGRVENNLVVDYYLQALKETLAAGEPSLRKVLRYDEPDSYPADYYPVGWGLVYFFRNYEDENSERVYEPLYAKYMDAYRTGGKHDKFERFVELFVTKPKLPGVATFEEFEARFKAWIDELHDLHYGPPDRAKTILERARKQREAGKTDAAIVSYRWALTKRPRDLLALDELAALYSQDGRKDQAISTLRQVIELCRRELPDVAADGYEKTTHAELAAQCLERIRKLDKLVANVLDASTKELDSRVRDNAAKYVQAKRPRSALRILDTAVRVLADPESLLSLRKEIAAESRVDVRRRRRLRVTDDLEDWLTGASWSVRDGKLVGTTDSLDVAVYAEQPPESYRFEATFVPVRATDETFMGIVWGLSEDGVLDVFDTYADGVTAIHRATKKWETLAELPYVDESELDVIRMAIEVERGVVRFIANGKELHARRFTPAELQGRVGVTYGEGTVEVLDIALVY